MALPAVKISFAGFRVAFEDKLREELSELMMIWAFFELFCVVIAKIEENIYQRRLIKGVIDLLEVFR